MKTRMMKYCRAIASVAFSMVFCAGVYGQSALLEDSYEKWRAEALGGVPTTHRALSITAVRVGDTVQIQARQNGEAGDLQISLEPGKLEGAGNRDFISTGEVYRANQKRHPSGPQINRVSDLAMSLPADSDANVIRLKWTITDDESDSAVFILIPVTTAPEANTVGIVRNADSAHNRTPLCSLLCY